MGVDNLQKAYESTAAVLARVNADQLDNATPCASWKVRDLINHLVGGTTFFAVTTEAGQAPGRGGAAEDFASGDFKAAFDGGAKRALAAFQAEGAMDKAVTLGFGSVPGAVFVNMAATDAFAHSWDIAKATGQSTDLDSALATELLQNARRSVRDSMRGPDMKAPFGSVVTVPESAPPADQLAGYLGRHP